MGVCVCVRSGEPSVFGITFISYSDIIDFKHVRGKILPAGVCVGLQPRPSGLFLLSPEPGNLWAEPCMETKTDKSQSVVLCVCVCLVFFTIDLFPRFPGPDAPVVVAENIFCTHFPASNCFQQEERHECKCFAPGGAAAMPRTLHGGGDN